jgi:hypothetical protein
METIFFVFYVIFVAIGLAFLDGREERRIIGVIPELDSPSECLTPGVPVFLF